MKATYKNALKVYQPIVDSIENEVKELLGDFYEKQRTRVLSIIELETAKGRFKQLYDEGALLLIELGYNGDNSNYFIERYFKPAEQENPKKFESFSLQIQNEYLLTVWPN